MATVFTRPAFSPEGQQVRLWRFICKEVAGLFGWHRHTSPRMTLKECEEELPRIREEMQEMRERLTALEGGQRQNGDSGAPAHG